MSSKLSTLVANISLNRRTADRLVAVLIIGILAVGGYATLRAYWRLRTTSGMMRMMPGMDPILYAFGTLIAVSVVFGTYAVTRDTFTTNPPTKKSIETTQEVGPTPNRDSGKMDSEHDSIEQNNDPQVLDILPEDERRVINPVLESPGLTQVELRGRSDFSKAKVSQTVSELEDRGLLYREQQGRTYRVYPGELLKNNNSTHPINNHD